MKNFACVITMATLSTGWMLATESKPEMKGEVSSVIPLALAHSTSRQAPLRLIDRGINDERCKGELAQLYDHSIRIGASNVFLVAGGDIAGAVKASTDVFCYGRSVDKIVITQGKALTGWVVVYLGVKGSDGPAWSVERLELKDKSFRMTYRWSGFRLADLHPYFYWLPVGKLQPGTYSLELFDAERKESTLRRHVKVVVSGN